MVWKKPHTTQFGRSHVNRCMMGSKDNQREQATFISAHLGRRGWPLFSFGQLRSLICSILSGFMLFNLKIERVTIMGNHLGV